MAECEGKLVICSRCGEQKFLKKLGTYTLDGGYSGPYSKYEELGGDWLYITQLGGYLCPKCSLRFKHMIREYMGHHRIKNVAQVWRVITEETANA